jgi:hypothetical protein
MSGSRGGFLAWMQQLVSVPEVFYSHTLAHLVQEIVIANEPRNLTHTMLFLRSKTIAIINANLDDDHRATSDSTILAVLALAYHDLRISERRVMVDKTNPGPAVGPLRTLRMLNLFGRIEHDPIHYEGLTKMIGLRGGLDQLTLPCLAASISQGEVLVSSKLLRCPKHAFVPFMDFDLMPTLEANRRPDHPLRSLGTAFRRYSSDSDTYSRKAVWKCLEDLALYSLGVDDYVSGRMVRHRLDVIADQRNFVHHGCLSLLYIHGDSETSLLTRICHLAGLSYSLVCVHPMDEASYHELAYQMIEILRREEFAAEWNNAPELVTWVLFITGMIAKGLKERVWVVATLERCTRKLRVDSWEAMKELLQRHLWLSMTNDQDGIVLWSEMEASNPFKAQIVEANALPSKYLQSHRLPQYELPRI